MLLTVLYKLEKSVLEVSAGLRLQQKEVLQKEYDFSTIFE